MARLLGLVLAAGAIACCSGCDLFAIPAPQSNYGGSDVLVVDDGNGAFPGTQEAYLADDEKVEAEKELGVDDASKPTLTINMLSNRTQSGGGEFAFEALVKRGSSPVSDATVGIYDPVKNNCTYVRTNALGRAKYTLRTTSSSRPSIYDYVFAIDSMKVASTVAVRSQNSGQRILNARFDMVTAKDLEAGAKVLGVRASSSGITQTKSESVDYAVNFGKEVLVDYFKNPFNAGAGILTIAVCTAGEAVPIAGQVSCAAAVEYVAAGIARTAAVKGTERLIDKIPNSKMSATQKSDLKRIVEAGNTILEISQYKPEKGLGVFNKITEASLGYDYGTTVVIPVYQQGKMVGCSLAANQTNGASTIQVSVIKR